jgi:CelD/BcsL family acetyltransferase involved in cellulose biosynthesis
VARAATPHSTQIEPEFHATSVTGLDALLALEPEWRDLLRRSRTQNPFLSWEWVCEWCRSFCGDSLVTVVVRDPSGTVAIAPFCRAGQPVLPGLSVHRLQLYGAGHHFEMREVLVEPSLAEPALRSLVAHLLQVRGWHWIELGAWEGSARAWERLAEPGWLPVRAVWGARTPVPTMRLPESWEALRAGLRRNVKESIRHAHNSLAREGREVRYHEHRGGDGLDQVLDDLFRLHGARARLGGRVPHPDQFDTHELREFTRRVAHALAGAGVLNLGVLEVDGRLAAVRFNMEMNAALYLHHSGFDPALWRYGVMTLLVTEGIRSAIARGLEVVNFSPGTDQAKARWKVEDRPMVDLVLIRKTPRWLLLYLLWSGLRAVKRAWRRARTAP